MKRFASAFLALASACAAVTALRADRPHYGGTLRVDAAATLKSLSLDPGAPAADPAEAAARARILPLVYETLTRVDEELRPGLASTWEHDERQTRWTFKLRAGVVLHDGATLDAFRAAASLRNADNRWNVSAVQADTLLIQLPEPAADLPWRLAEPSYAIVVRAAAGRLFGTGPFRVERLDPDLLSLRAHEEHRAGRPFLDGVQIRMGRSLPTQLADVEGGRADFVSVQATDARRVLQRGMQLTASRPIEWVALVFEPHWSGDELLAMRKAIAASINRSTLSGVLLQQQAVPATSVLPVWLSGYTSQAPAAVATLPAARRELLLRVDPSDTLLQAVGERVAVDARERGLSIKVQVPSGTVAPRPDARLVRIRVPATLPERAYAAVVDRLTPRASADVAQVPPASLDALFRAEAAFFDRAVVVPLVHLNELYAASESVHFGSSRPVQPGGAWDFADVSLRARP